MKIETPKPESLKVEVPKVEIPGPVGNPPFTQQERCPSDWIIEKDGSHVIGHNRITHRVFDGDISEFNRLMRG